MDSKQAVTDFAYWIQGVIEVGQLTTFSEEQIEAIRQRAQQLTKEYPKNSGSFVSFVLSETSPVLHAPWTPRKLEGSFRGINSELQRMFTHVIDPTYEGVVGKAELNAAHAGPPSETPASPQPTERIMSKAESELREQLSKMTPEEQVAWGRALGPFRC